MPSSATRNTIRCRGSWTRSAGLGTLFRPYHNMVHADPHPQSADPLDTFPLRVFGDVLHGLDEQGRIPHAADLVELVLTPIQDIVEFGFRRLRQAKVGHALSPAVPWSVPMPGGSDHQARSASHHRR